VKLKSRELFLYVAIGVLVLLFTIWQALYMPAHIKLAFDHKWIDLGICTALVFGVLIQGYRRHQESRRLWPVLSVLFVIHVAVFAAILTHTKRWPFPMNVLVFSAEIMLLALVVYLIAGVTPRFDGAAKT
jgi:hypothetical protein